MTDPRSTTPARPGAGARRVVRLARPRPACVLLALLASFAGALANAVSIDAQMLDRGSDLAYRRALGPAADARQLNANVGVTVRVRKIANRLVSGASAAEAEAKRLHWAVNVIPGAAPDVRVYPGGRVIVHESLLTATGLGDDEIGAILAHAFAHLLLGHDARRIELPERLPTGDPNRAELAIADATADALRRLRYTAAEVAAADRASVEILARAAYDPRAAGSAWRRLAVAGKGIVERIPVGEERLQGLDAASRAVVPLFEETRAKAEAYERAQRTRPPARITGPGGGPPMR